MNICMLCDGDKVLVLNKTGSNHSGTMFPGGHAEAGETFTEAVIREMKEETGLPIHHPLLKGIYHWYRAGKRFPFQRKVLRNLSRMAASWSICSENRL